MRNLDLLITQVRASEAKREAELREAFRDPYALRLLILTDCANLIAGIGGYAAPMEREARQSWIEKQMLNDPIFVAKVHSAANLVSEYVGANLRS